LRFFGGALIALNPRRRASLTSSIQVHIARTAHAFKLHCNVLVEGHRCSHASKRTIVDALMSNSDSDGVHIPNSAQMVKGLMASKPAHRRTRFAPASTPIAVGSQSRAKTELPSTARIRTTRALARSPSREDWRDLRGILKLVMGAKPEAIRASALWRGPVRAGAE
jgi:hypothetical protein